MDGRGPGYGALTTGAHNDVLLPYDYTVLSPPALLRTQWSWFWTVRWTRRARLVSVYWMRSPSTSHSCVWTWNCSLYGLDRSQDKMWNASVSNTDYLSSYKSRTLQLTTIDTCSMPNTYHTSHYRISDYNWTSLIQICNSKGWKLLSCSFTFNEVFLHKSALSTLDKRGKKESVINLT